MAEDYDVTEEDREEEVKLRKSQIYFYSRPVELNDELILHVCQAVFVPRSLVMVFMPIIRSYEQR